LCLAVRQNRAGIEIVERLKIASLVRIALWAVVFVVPPLTAWSDDIISIPRIIDADTVEVSAVKVRLEAVDAPETDQLCLNQRGERWACGIEARERLKEHAGNKLWTCHLHGADRFRRALASCDADGEDIQRWLVTNGWALAFTRYSHKYDVEQETARIGKRGLWSGAFIAPWDWRHRTKSTEILGSTYVPIDAQTLLLSAVSATGAPSPDCTIKGNINRKGECIYHLPGGSHYSAVKMDTSRGKRWFCSTEDAEAAGCRASKN